MSIRYDPLVARALARALHARLEGVRVRAVHFLHDLSEARLHTDEGVLVVTLVGGNEPPELRFLPPEEPPEAARRIPLKVHSVEAVRDERIVTVGMHRIRGSSGTHALVVEFRPGDANVAFTEGDEGIVRHLLVTRESRGRNWRSGHPYPYPAGSERAGAEADLDADGWREATRGDGEARRALLGGVAYTSSLNADWILGASTPEGAHARWRELTSSGEEVVLLAGGQPYPHPLGDEDPQSIDLLEFLTDGGAGIDEGALRRELLGRAERQINRARKRREAIERQLREAPDPEAIRARGDLLLSRLHEVSSGVDRVELVDFEGQPITLELEPGISPQENAAALYDEAGRAERAREKLPGLIRAAEQAEARWTALAERFRAGEISSEELESELPDPRDSAQGSDGPTHPYRRFMSSGGIEIRVGRGAKRNDDLTFHHSRPDDVWMHARHAAGAHVVLRWAEDGAPPARDLHEAATIAALNSKARTSGSVPVDWTRRKYVRKPRGAPPGAVVMEYQDTVFVEPDPELAERLAVDDD